MNHYFNPPIRVNDAAPKIRLVVRKSESCPPWAGTRTTPSKPNIDVSVRLIQRLERCPHCGHRNGVDRLWHSKTRLFARG